jgi:predicted metalloendopeptidase
MMQTDPHPTGKFRVIGPPSNLPEFQKAFAARRGRPWCARARSAARSGEGRRPQRRRT